ncbi:MAG: SDR family oxidoreductase [Candidatus Dormiibacterota bacterium]
MRVFVTGATGHIGSPVVAELLEAGHWVVGLARSDQSAAALASAGAEVHRGSLDDLDSLSRGAAGADGVIHLAYRHDLSLDSDGYADAAAIDLRAVEAIGEALAGSGKPFVVTSGTGRFGTEQDALETGSPPRPRIASENAAVALGGRGVRSSVVRLAPSVHSSLDHHGFIPRLIGIARRSRASAYVGDGSNRWAAVHTIDAAHLYRMALEAAPAGSRLHGVGDEGVPFLDIAGAIGRHLDLPVISISREDADARFGALSTFVSSDLASSSALTQKLLGWQPVHPGLIADLEQGHYFEMANAMAGRRADRGTRSR